MQIPVDFLHWGLAFLPILALAFLLVQLRWTAEQLQLWKELSSAGHADDSEKSRRMMISGAVGGWC